MTGTASRIIHSGRFSECLNAETTFRRLMAFCFFWPLPFSICFLSSVGERVQVDLLEQVLDGLGAHATAEVVAVAELHLAIERLVVHEVLHGELLEAIERLAQQIAALLEFLVEVLGCRAWPRPRAS